MATTVKKGAKINFYKFVSPKTEGAQGSDANPSLTNSLRGNVRAINNLGKTVNSITGDDYRDIKEYELQ